MKLTSHRHSVVCCACVWPSDTLPERLPDTQRLTSEAFWLPPSALPPPLLQADKERAATKSAANVTKLLNRNPRRFRPGAVNRWCMVGPAFHPTIGVSNRTPSGGGLQPLVR